MRRQEESLERWDCLEGFQYRGFTVGKVWYNRAGDRIMLVDPERGGTMILSEDLFKELLVRKPGDDLLFKLTSRGFASVEGGPAVRVQEDCPPRPTFFMLDLTSKCNFSCEYCLREIEGNNESITWEQLDYNLDKLIEYAKESGIRGLTIQPWGGEPMLEFDKILHIKERFDQNGIFLVITMETNGSLITSERAQKLKEAGIKVGVSIDGTPQIHDYYRHLQSGKDTSTFALARRGLENLRDAGFKTIGGIGVVTKQTLDHLEEVLDYNVMTLGFTGFKLTIMHSPANKTLCQDILTEEEIKEYTDRLIDRLIYYYHRGIRVLESSISNRMSNLIYRSRNNICISNGCRGGRRLLSIDKHGTIFLCELMDRPEQAIGSVFDSTSIGEMVEKAIREKEYFREKKMEKCDNCPWWYYCRGGCTGIVLYERGQVDRTDDISCAFNRRAYARLSRIILEDPELAMKFI